MIKMEPFKYINTPHGYVCSKCGASGCKLWRQYQTFLEHIELTCAKCSGADISTLDADGKVESTVFKKGGRVTNVAGDVLGVLGDANNPMPRTDQLGGLMPAVPTEDGTTFWGYTSVPDAGVRWWKSLPSIP